MTGQRQQRITALLCGLRTRSVESLRQEFMLAWGIKDRTWRDYMEEAKAALEGCHLFLTGRVAQDGHVGTAGGAV